MSFQGKVADLRVFSSGDRMLLMQAVLKAGFGRIGIYREGFIHVDVGKYPANVMWVE